MTEQNFESVVSHILTDSSSVQTVSWDWDMGRLKHAEIHYPTLCSKVKTKGCILVVFRPSSMRPTCWRSPLVWTLTCIVSVYMTLWMTDFTMSPLSEGRLSHQRRSWYGHTVSRECLRGEEKIALSQLCLICYSIYMNLLTRFHSSRDLDNPFSQVGDSLHKWSYVMTSCVA